MKYKLFLSKEGRETLENVVYGGFLDYHREVSHGKAMTPDEILRAKVTSRAVVKIMEAILSIENKL